MSSSAAIVGSRVRACRTHEPECRVYRGPRPDHDIAGAFKATCNVVSDQRHTESGNNQIRQHAFVVSLNRCIWRRQRSLRKQITDKPRVRADVGCSNPRQPADVFPLCAVDPVGPCGRRGDPINQAPQRKREELRPAASPKKKLASSSPLCTPANAAPDIA